jgi:hypothetical protein
VSGHVEDMLMLMIVAVIGEYDFSTVIGNALILRIYSPILYLLHCYFFYQSYSLIPQDPFSTSRNFLICKKVFTT